MRLLRLLIRLRGLGGEYVYRFKCQYLLAYHEDLNACYARILTS